MKWKNLTPFGGGAPLVGRAGRRANATRPAGPPGRTPWPPRCAGTRNPVLFGTPSRRRRMLVRSAVHTWRRRFISCARRTLACWRYIFVEHARTSIDPGDPAFSFVLSFFFFKFLHWLVVQQRFLRFHILFRDVIIRSTGIIIPNRGPRVAVRTRPYCATVLY